MTFPVYSISTVTPSVDRIIRVLQRAKVAPRIARAGVYNCRKIAGSSSWSQHSWGNAVDLFPDPPIFDDQQDLRAIANAVVYQATHRTIANRGRTVKVGRVIDHDASRQWTPAGGWHPYGGAKGPHVHVEGSPTRLGVPPCG